MSRSSFSSSPASGNWRTTVSAFSSLSTILNCTVAWARFFATRRACPSGSPRRGGAIAGVVMISSAIGLPAVVDLDADQVGQLIIGDLQHLDADPVALVDDDQVGDAVDA